MRESRPFKEFAILQRGFDLPLQDRVAGEYPIISSSGVSGTHAVRGVSGPGVVTGRSGTIGRVHYAETDYWPLNTTLFVKDFKGNDPRYVALVLEAMDLSKYAAGSTVPSLNRNVLDQVRVFAPDVDEQQRIVDLIDALDEAIEAAQLTLVSTVNLRHEMAGVVFSGLQGGAHELLGDIASTRLGKMLSSTTAGDDPEWPYLRNANVQWGHIDLSDLKKMPLSDADRVEFELKKGDLLVCEGGYVGRSAIVIEDLPGVYFQKALHRIRCGESITPEFLYFYMEFLERSGGLEDFTTGTTIRHLTGEKLRQIPVPIVSRETLVSITGPLVALVETDAEAKNIVSALQAARRELLAACLSGEYEIPSSYDEAMGVSA
jgi:type I restriction enzyme S subunit